MRRKKATINSETRLIFKDPIYKIIYSGAVNNVSDWKKNMHSHDFSEIMYVKKGRGQIIINDKKFEAKYGDLIVYNPGDLHQEICYENQEFKVLFIAIKELGVMEQQSILGSSNNHIVSTGVSALRFKNYFQDIVEAMQNKRNNSTDLPIYLAGLIVALVKKIFNSKQIINNDLSSLCENVKQVIDRDFCIIKSIDDALKDLYVSKYYFYDKFKEMYSLTPLQYLKSKKLKYSEELLKNTEMKISEIASLIGYDNELYFSRIFKKEKNISATQYREKFRKSN